MPIRPKAGKRYVRQDGQETGPLERRDSPIFPLRDPRSGETYADDGKAYDWEHPSDLIAEVPDAPADDTPAGEADHGE